MSETERLARLEGELNNLKSGRPNDTDKFKRASREREIIVLARRIIQLRDRLHG